MSVQGRAPIYILRRMLGQRMKIKSRGRPSELRHFADELAKNNENYPLYTALRDAAMDIELMREALEKLSRLGNEPHYGNSTGNTIAREALKRV